MSPPPWPLASETRPGRQRLARSRSLERARRSYEQMQPTDGHEPAQSRTARSTPAAALQAHWSGDDRRSNGSPGSMRDQKRPESATRSRCHRNPSFDCSADRDEPWRGISRQSPPPPGTRSAALAASPGALDSRLPVAEDERRRQRQSQSARSDARCRGAPVYECEYQHTRSHRESARQRSSSARRSHRQRDQRVAAHCSTSRTRAA